MGPGKKKMACRPHCHAPIQGARQEYTAGTTHVACDAEPADCDEGKYHNIPEGAGGRRATYMSGGRRASYVSRGCHAPALLKSAIAQTVRHSNPTITSVTLFIEPIKLRHDLFS